jgi:hypothetical protein
MSRTFGRDASRWERGELSREDLQARHPQVDLTAVSTLERDLEALAEGPAPDVDRIWFMVGSRIDDRSRVERARPSSRGVTSRRAVVALATAAMLGGTSIAYAAGLQPVRRGVDSVVSSVRGLFGGHPASPRDPFPTIGPSSVPTAPAGTGDGGSHHAGTSPSPAPRDGGGSAGEGGGSAGGGGTEGGGGTGGGTGDGGGGSEGGGDQGGGSGGGDQGGGTEGGGQGGDGSGGDTGSGGSGGDTSGGSGGDTGGGSGDGGGGGSGSGD